MEFVEVGRWSYDLSVNSMVTHKCLQPGGHGVGPMGRKGDGGVMGCGIRRFQIQPPGSSVPVTLSFGESAQGCRFVTSCRLKQTPY